MASKYLLVLLILCIAGFVTLGIKKLLLMRRGFRAERKPINWIMIGLLALLTIFLVSCNSKTAENEDGTPDGEREVESVVVTRKEEKTTDVHRIVDGKGNVTATVTTSTKGNNGEIITEEKTFKGTRAEVEAKLKAFK